MIAYDFSDQHDLLLAQWWGAMRQTVDEVEFEMTFSKTLRPLGAFLGFWRGSTFLVFDTDEKGITAAMWFQPVVSGPAAFAGLWVRQDKRHSPDTFSQIEQTYGAALNRWTVLLGLTKQKQLLRAHRRLGYQVLGQLPRIWDGDMAWVVFLTREAWHGRRIFRQREGRSAASQERGRSDSQPVR